mmetsp:Transcript_4234/g.7186  ORF Transcript_4234/g.7186 Transcript_4234/m.7186 type:complete len:508 (-) Transcript_4234:644-2167(-)
MNKRKHDNISTSTSTENKSDSSATNPNAESNELSSLGEDLDSEFPPIRFINFEDYRQLKEFPRYPENKDICVTKEDIDHSTSFIVFISHNWARGHAAAAGWSGRPHPDNDKHDKHALSITGIDKMKKVFAPGMESCYVWLDFGCMNQDDNPAGELRQLNEIVQFTDCIFTPIAGMATLLPTYKSMYSDYVVDAWNAEKYGYVNRGWCRVEMFYAANIPFGYNTDDRLSKFNVGLKFHIAQGVRPHALFGFRERDLNETPRLLPPLQNSTFEDMHPEKGEVTHESDRNKIRELVEELRPYMNYADHGYQGELVNGKRHGYGKLTCDNGDIYEGNFMDDCQEGQGVFIYANGYKYEGEFQKGKWHGVGKFTFADGGYYSGDFSCGKFHGKGKFVFVHGDEYEGEVVGNMRHGYGKYSYANGNSFKGTFEENRMIKGVFYADVRDGLKKEYNAIFDNVESSDITDKSAGSGEGGDMTVTLTNVKEGGGDGLDEWYTKGHFTQEGTFVALT